MALGICSAMGRASAPYSKVHGLMVKPHRKDHVVRQEARYQGETRLNLSLAMPSWELVHSYQTWPTPMSNVMSPVRVEPPQDLVTFP